MNKYNFNGKNVYVGIDVHKASFTITSRCEGMTIKQSRMSASPEALVKFLSKNFTGGSIFTAYEAGFSGFHLHRFLIAQGFHSIVVHPASIEISARDRVKTDKRDSLKIASQLEAGRLRGIHVPDYLQEARRELSRLREQFVRQRHQAGCRITSFFHRHQELVSGKRGVLSRRFVENLSSLSLNPSLKNSLALLCEAWLFYDDKIKELNRELKMQAKEDEVTYRIIRSTPGIGELSACILFNERGDMSQFSSAKKLFSFTGLTPSEFSSGETRRQGHITRQGRSILRKVLVQAAWVAIKRDLDLQLKYLDLAKKIGAKKAIVAIARKLIGRIRKCLIMGELYKTQTVS